MTLVLLFGYEMAIAAGIASFFTNYAISSTFSIPLTIAMAAGLQAALGGHLLSTLNRKNFFRDYSDIFAVLTVSAVGGALTASICNYALLTQGVIAKESFLYAWYTWWSGDAIGLLMILPLALDLKDQNLSPPGIKKILETVFMAAAMVGVLYLTFTRDLNQAFLWLSAPAFIFLGVRCGKLSSSIVLIIVSCFVATLTVLGHWPFHYGNTNRNLIYIQTLISAYALCVLFVKRIEIGSIHGRKFFAGFAAATVLLFVLTYFTTYFERKNTQSDYETLVNTAIASLNKSVEQLDLIIKSASGGFAMSDEVTRAEFTNFVESIHPNEYLEVLKGLGFIAWVPKEAATTHLEKHHLKLKILDSAYSDSFIDRYVITFLEPEKGNEEALGLDIGSEQNRREAADQAREKDETITTSPIKLIQDPLKRKAFLILHPALDPRGRFLGWTYAPVISNAFFKKPLEPLKDSLQLRISVGDGNVLFETPDASSAIRQGPFYFRQTLKIFGKDHLIEAYPSDLFFRRHSDYSVGIPLILTLLVLIISALIVEQMTFGLRAEELVEERTRELEASKMQLVESSKMASLGEMASGMAHEINNPLTIIQGKIQVIHMILGDLNIYDKKLLEELGKIKLTTDRIEKIIKGLRNFSRTASNDPFERTSLQTIVSETLDLCSERIRSEGITLSMSEIPKVWIECRPSEISQVLINLLNNSRDAIDEMQTKWIKLNFSVNDKFLRIEVSDSGPGISTELAGKIMNPFFTTKVVGKGTGLGLSISRNIIKLHGEELWFDSSAESTTFVIELKYTA